MLTLTLTVVTSAMTLVAMPLTAARGMSGAATAVVTAVRLPMSAAGSAFLVAVVIGTMPAVLVAPSSRRPLHVLLHSCVHHGSQ